MTNRQKEADFAAFYAEHYDSVRRSLTVVAGDVEAGREAAQTAFAKAFGSWTRVALMGKPSGWVYVVGTREALKQARGRQRLHQLQGASRDSSGSDGDVVLALDARRAVMALPPRQKAVVILRFWADLPVRDIARALRCRPGTVKSTLHAALSSLEASPSIARPETDPPERRARAVASRTRRPPGPNTTKEVT